LRRNSASFAQTPHLIKPRQIREAGLSEAREDVDLFQGAFLVRELPPFYANIGKRLRKHPKLYLRDSGLLHGLLQLRERAHVESHPRYGASWEGFCIEQIIHLTRTRDEECFTWSVQGGAEVDLIITKPGGVIGFEFKAGDAPRGTPSMITALAELPLTKLFVIYPGSTDYVLDERLEVVGFPNLSQLAQKIV
jgi:predicted AAA+ superfamily ATPase